MVPCPITSKKAFNAAAIALNPQFRASIQTNRETSGARVVAEVLAQLDAGTGQVQFVRRALAEAALLLGET